jgi:hypothetical protein
MIYVGNVTIDKETKRIEVLCNGENMHLSRAHFGVLHVYNLKSACNREELLRHLEKIKEESSQEALGKVVADLKELGLLIEVDLWLYRTDKGQAVCIAIVEQMNKDNL